VKILDKSRPRISLPDLSLERVTHFLQEQLQGKGVIEAYLFGSLAAGTSHAWSDIDLLIVQNTEVPFVERARAFTDVFELGVPVDILVYTQEEFDRLRADNSGFWREFNQHNIKII